MKDYKVSSDNQPIQTTSRTTGEDNIPGVDSQPLGPNLQPQITALPAQSAGGEGDFPHASVATKGDRREGERSLSLDARSAVG